MLSFEFSIFVKIVLTIQGTIPYISWFSMSGPYIVNVLPDPVWPYAKIVPLNPSRTPLTWILLTLNDWLSSLNVNFLLGRVNVKHSIECKLIRCHFSSFLLVNPTYPISSDCAAFLVGMELDTSLAASNWRELTLLVTIQVNSKVKINRPQQHYLLSPLVW